jgi:hypothetical protein
MKPRLSMLSLLLAVACGCANFEKNAYRTLAVTGAAENAAVRAFKQFEQQPSSPVTDQQRAQARAGHAKFVAAYDVAVDALQEYHDAKVKNKAAAQIAIDAALHCWRDVYDLVMLVLPPEKAAKLKEVLP